MQRTGCQLDAIVEYDELGFVKRVACPYCGSEALKHSHTDDIGNDWLKCENCWEYCTYPKKKERKTLETILANAVNVQIIHLSNIAITPMLNGLSRKVHPAIDILNGLAVVGIILPCTVMDKDGRQSEKELPFYVSSKRELILCHMEVLAKLRWKLAYKVVSFENRWSLKGITEFLNGKTVEPKTIYLSVKNAWKTYIEFDKEEYYDLLTLWVVGTYFFFIFNAYPYIYVGGVKGAGKTKVLNVASFMCHNAVFSNNISTSSIYRLIQSGRCTLLMDETEKLSEKDRAMELRNLLLSGYKKGAKVYRTEKKVGERFVPEAFDVYSPKMIVNIKGLEDVLEDRCITIIMKRGKNRNITNNEPKDVDPHWQEIRDSLYNLFLTCFIKVVEVYEVSEVCADVGSYIAGRELELWKPLFTLAKFFDTYSPELNLTEKMKALASEKAREKETENMTETGEYILVQTLLRMVKENGERYYSVREIKEKMAKAFDEQQDWLSSKWIGRALKRLGFTEKRRVGTGCEYRLSMAVVQDLAERLNIQMEGEANEETRLFLTTQTSPTAQTTLAEKLEQIKTWLIKNRNEDGLIDAEALALEIKGLGLDVQQTVQLLKDEYWLREVPQIGKFGVR